MSQSTRQTTRAALVRSAERLIAEKGLGTVSVKDITRAAGARNPSAVHYHFGNVETLIKEVFSQRYQAIEDVRLARLADVNVADKAKRVVALVEAAIAPFLETCLEEEGRLYVRFVVQFASDPRFDLGEMVGDIGMDSLVLLQDRLIACIDGVDSRVLASRLRHSFNISLIQAADYARAIEKGRARPLEQVIHESAITLAGYLTARSAEPGQPGVSDRGLSSGAALAG